MKVNSLTHCHLFLFAAKWPSRPNNYPSSKSRPMRKQIHLFSTILMNIDQLLPFVSLIYKLTNSVTKVKFLYACSDFFTTANNTYVRYLQTVVVFMRKKYFRG